MALNPLPEAGADANRGLHGSSNDGRDNGLLEGARVDRIPGGGITPSQEGLDDDEASAMQDT